jgi:DNA-binding IscR family transcriptional regulator
MDGGYRLARDLEEISMLDVIEAIEGPLRDRDTTGDLGLTKEARSKLQSAFQSISDHSRVTLTNLKLTQLLPPKSGGSSGSSGRRK